MKGVVVEEIYVNKDEYLKIKKLKQSTFENYRNILGDIRARIILTNSHHGYDTKIVVKEIRAGKKLKEKE